MRFRFATAVVLAAVAAACSDRSPTTPLGAPAGGLQYAISDGAHNNGNPNFFFLPPLVTNPNQSATWRNGSFNPNLMPVVRVFLLPEGGASDCTIPGTPAYGPAPLRPDGASEQYALNWDTKASVLSPGATYRICVYGTPAEGAMLLGLVDVQPVAGGMKKVATNEIYGFQDDRTLPIKVRIQNGVLSPLACIDPASCSEATVVGAAPGSAGDTAKTIVVPSGYAALALPPSAVKEGDVVTLVIEKQAPPYGEGGSAKCLPTDLQQQSTGCWRFASEPAPYHFDVDVRMEICVLPGDLDPGALRVFKNDEQGLQELPWADPTLIACDQQFTAMRNAVGSGSSSFASAALQRVGRWASGLLAPAPLYAAMRGLPPKGLGGTGNGFSDLGGAIPAAVPECSGVTEIPAAECGALVALYKATDGANWWTNTDWLQTNTPCTWFGVTCAGGAVQALVLNYNNLTGVLPSELGNLTALETLRLDSNLVVGGAIPATLGSLSHLRTLNLSSNRLTGELPSSLGNLTSLETLGAQSNLLTGAIPASFGSLTALQSLALDYNQLSGSIPAAIGNLAALKSLSLGGNQLTGAIPIELGNLHSLENLYLASNQLTGSIPAELGNLSHLSNLGLGSNLLTGSIPGALGNLSNLSNLDLYQNQLSGVIPDQMGNLPALAYLNLSENQLSGSIPIALSSLTSLQGLSLRSNQLTGTIPAAMGAMTALRGLSLGENQLSGAIPSELGNLTSLEGLSLESNQLAGLVPLSVAQIGGRLRWNCNFTPGNTGLYVPDTPDYRAADLHNYGTICGVPFTPVAQVQIDGTMSPGEWDQADHYTGTVTLPDNSTTAVDIYMTNDATNLYSVVRFGRDISAWGLNFGIYLDENQNGLWDGHEDGWVAQAWRKYGGGNPPNLFFDMFFSSSVQPPQGQADDQYGGTNDGIMATGTSGTVVEMVHPLHNSLDATHDAQLVPGSVFSFKVSVDMPQFPVTVTTYLPSPSTWSSYTVR